MLKFMCIMAIISIVIIRIIAIMVIIYFCSYQLTKVVYRVRYQV